MKLSFGFIKEKQKLYKYNRRFHVLKPCFYKSNKYYFLFTVIFVGDLKLFCTTLFCLILFNTAQALVRQPHHVVIDKKMGLPSNEVYSMLQDSLGFMWLATSEGVVRYDGVQFKTYAHPQQSSKAGSSIALDKYGRIWYENFDGYVYYIQNETMHQLPKQKSIGYFPFGIMGDYVLVLQEKGINIYALGNLSLIKFIPIDYKVGVYSYCDKNGFYLTLDNKYYELNNKLELATAITLPSPSKQIKQLTRLNNETWFYVKYNDAKELFATNKLSMKTKRLSIRQPKLIHHVAAIDNQFWVLTPNGAYIYDSVGNQPMGANGLFTGKSISAVIKDRQGNHWFATTNEGLILVPNLENEIISLGGYKPNRIVATDIGYIVGTQRDELLLFDTAFKNASLLWAADHLASINMLKYNVANQLLFVGSSKFMLFRAPKWSIKDTYFQAIKDIEPIDDKYFAYAATGSSGIMLGAQNHIAKKVSIWDELYAGPYLKSLNQPNFKGLLERTRGRAVAVATNKQTLYFATNSGLHSLTYKGNLKEIQFQNQSLHVTAIAVWENYLYVLSNKGTVYLLGKDDALIMQNAKWNLPLGSIKQLKLFDNALYLLTDNNTICTINLAQENEAVNHIGTYIAAGEVNDYIKIRKTIALLTNNSIVLIKMNSVNKREVAPKFVINSFSANGSIIQNFEGKKFDYGTNNITLQFSLLDFGAEPSLPIYYRLNESQWIKVDKHSRSLNLPALSAGRYNILFALGDDKKTQHKISFTINPAIWQTWWFGTAILFIITALGILFYRHRITRLKTRSSILQQKVELERNLSQSMLTSIKAQMNPHFFYNALNTIQAFIFTNDKRNASSYLTKFSKLTRTILEMSEQENISLDEELNALELYLELEKMRFEDSFEYKIRKDESLDTSLVRIPAMLIQPFVENAIKHGLMHIKGAKMLRIDFSTTGKNLTVIVDDNGIGRKKANEINSKKKYPHKSFAIGANEKRFEILNKGLENKLSVEIIDKNDDHDYASGTRVILNIPIF